MRGLTVRQPWAWAIVHGGKDVENRSRSLGPYRGEVAIHAGLHVADGPIIHPTGLWTGTPGKAAWVALGAVIGVVDLWLVHRAALCECGGEHCSPWAEPDMWHLGLANPRPLVHPIPWRGAQGLWTVPADLEAAIRAQVTP